MAGKSDDGQTTSCHACKSMLQIMSPDGYQSCLDTNIKVTKVFIDQTTKKYTLAISATDYKADCEEKDFLYLCDRCFKVAERYNMVVKSGKSDEGSQSNQLSPLSSEAVDITVEGNNADEQLINPSSESATFTQQTDVTTTLNLSPKLTEQSMLEPNTLEEHADNQQINTPAVNLIFAGQPQVPLDHSTQISDEQQIDQSSESATFTQQTDVTTTPKLSPNLTEESVLEPNELEEHAEYQQINTPAENLIFTVQPQVPLDHSTQISDQQQVNVEEEEQTGDGVEEKEAVQEEQKEEDGEEEEKNDDEENKLDIINDENVEGQGELGESVLFEMVTEESREVTMIPATRNRPDCEGPDSSSLRKKIDGEERRNLRRSRRQVVSKYAKQMTGGIKEECEAICCSCGNKVNKNRKPLSEQMTLMFECQLNISVPRPVDATLRVCCKCTDVIQKISRDEGDMERIKEKFVESKDKCSQLTEEEAAKTEPVSVKKGIKTRSSSLSKKKEEEKGKIRRCYHCKSFCEQLKSRHRLFPSAITTDWYPAPAFIMEHDLNIKVPIPSDITQMEEACLCITCALRLRDIHLYIVEIADLREKLVASLSSEFLLGRLFFGSEVAFSSSKAPSEVTDKRGGEDQTAAVGCGECFEEIQIATEEVSEVQKSQQEGELRESGAKAEMLTDESRDVTKRPVKRKHPDFEGPDSSSLQKKQEGEERHYLRRSRRQVASKYAKRMTGGIKEVGKEMGSVSKLTSVSANSSNSLERTSLNDSKKVSTDTVQPYQCKYCSKGFQTQKSCQSHVIHHIESTIAKRKKDKDSYDQRIQKCFPSVTPMEYKKLRSAEDRKTYIKELKTEVDDAVAKMLCPPKHWSKTMGCRVCKVQDFDFMTHFLHHITSAHGVKPITHPYRCKWCHARFKRRNALTSHYCDKAPGERSCKCNFPECQKAFVTERQLKTHQKTHQRRHSCNLCERKFRTFPKLSNHLQRAHNERKLYKCKHCPKTFFSAALTKDHEWHEHTNSLNKICVCDQCGKTCKGIFHLRAHYKIHATERHYKCKYCGFRCKTASILGRHIKSHLNNGKLVGRAKPICECQNKSVALPMEKGKEEKSDGIISPRYVKGRERNTMLVGGNPEMQYSVQWYTNILKMARCTKGLSVQEAGGRLCWFLLKALVSRETLATHNFSGYTSVKSQWVPFPKFDTNILDVLFQQAKIQFPSFPCWHDRYCKTVTYLNRKSMGFRKYEREAKCKAEVKKQIEIKAKVPRKSIQNSKQRISEKQNRKKETQVREFKETTRKGKQKYLRSRKV